jgi:hypothetical protein
MSWDNEAPCGGCGGKLNAAPPPFAANVRRSVTQEWAVICPECGLYTRFCRKIGVDEPVPDHPEFGFDYEGLDPGIVNVVRMLRESSLQLETVDSGDGYTKLMDGQYDPEEVLDVPHVAVVCEPHELARIATDIAIFLRIIGVDVVPEGRATGTEDNPTATVSARYDPADDTAVILIEHLNDDGLAIAMSRMRGNRNEMVQA